MIFLIDMQISAVIDTTYMAISRSYQIIKCSKSKGILEGIIYFACFSLMVDAPLVTRMIPGSLMVLSMFSANCFNRSLFNRIVPFCHITNYSSFISNFNQLMFEKRNHSFVGRDFCSWLKC